MKRVHLIPRERQELVDSLMGSLRPQMEKYIASECMKYVQKEGIALLVQDLIKEVVIPKIEELALQEPLEPRWFAKFLFRSRKLP